MQMIVQANHSVQGSVLRLGRMKEGPETPARTECLGMLSHHESKPWCLPNDVPRKFPSRLFVQHGASTRHVLIESASASMTRHQSRRLVGLISADFVVKVLLHR